MHVIQPLCNSMHDDLIVRCSIHITMCVTTVSDVTCAISGHSASHVASASQGVFHQRCFMMVAACSLRRHVAHAVHSGYSNASKALAVRCVPVVSTSERPWVPPGKM
jgi:hypothetical protein